MPTVEGDSQAHRRKWGVHYHEPWPDAIALYYDRMRMTMVRESGTPAWMVTELQAIADHLNETGYMPTQAVLDVLSCTGG